MDLLNWKRFVFLILIGLPLFANAQGPVKIEREIGIKKKDVPLAAREWLEDAFENIKRPNWYQEFFENGFSYEAKFKLKGQFYSVEFDSLGNIQDVEVEMELEELSESVQENLIRYFEGNYEAFKINKIQIQYSGEAGDLEDFFDENEEEGITVRFEIEYRGKVSDKEDEIWEGLFSEEGILISKRKIELRIMDNLIF